VLWTIIVTHWHFNTCFLRLFYAALHRRDEAMCKYNFINLFYLIYPKKAIAEAKLRSQWSVMGWVTKNLSSRAPACFGRHVKPLVRTNPHWARVVGYGPFSLWVIHKEGLCPSSGDINRLMMIRKKNDYIQLINNTEISELSRVNTKV
jgi:hypothetical protein